MIVASTATAAFDGTALAGGAKSLVTTGFAARVAVVVAAATVDVVVAVDPVDALSVASAVPAAAALRMKVDLWRTR